MTRGSDVPCPKCGHINVATRWCDGSLSDPFAGDECRFGEPDHLHRSCACCRYNWKTKTLDTPTLDR